MTPPFSKLATDTARKLEVRTLGLDYISYLLEALAYLDEIRRQIGPMNVDAETLDETTPCKDGSAWLPKGAPLTRARLGRAVGRETECATLEFDLTHSSSVEVGRA